jgi:hypothetical protein
MKKTAGIVGGIALSLFSLALNAQQTWEAKNNPTVDSITAKYKDKEVVSKPASTLQDVFPVIGKYESATNPDAASLTINLDETNKGIAWIEGLPQGKVKAMLRKSPSTYKIPVQKTEDGKEVAEGTLIFDAATNTLRICIGKSFDAENPEAAFAAPVEAAVVLTKTAKTKKPVAPKAWIYTGTKMARETAAN